MFPESCFVKWYEHHQGLVLRETLKVSKSYLEESTRYARGIAEDLAADTWVNVWKKVQDGADIKYPKAYLKTSAHNRALNYFKRTENKLINSRRKK